jgi:Flp pilus assembly protein TadB
MDALFALAQAARHEVHCNCSDVTRIHVGPLSIPVGPLTAVFALVLVAIGPAWLLAMWRRRKQERAARELMAGHESNAR